MTINYCEGYDLVTDPAPSIVTGFDGTPTLVVGRSGGQALKITGTSNGTNRYSQIPLPHTSSVGSCAFAFYPGINFTVNTYVWSLVEGSTQHLALSLLGETLNLVHGSNTIIGSYAGLPLSAWSHLEVVWSIADAGGTANVYLNGDTTPIISFTGDTRNGATGTPTHVRLGFTSSSSNNGRSVTYDDVVIGDAATQIGDVKVETLRPTGDGATNAWLGSDGNSVNNWELVDDLLSTDYVGTATSAAKDLYTMGDLSTTGGDVYGVQVQVLAAKSDAGAQPGDLMSITRLTAGTERDAVLSTALGTTYAWMHAPFEPLDPDDAVWTIASVNAMQAGVRLP